VIMQRFDRRSLAPLLVVGCCYCSQSEEVGSSEPDASGVAASEAGPPATASRDGSAGGEATLDAAAAADGGENPGPSTDGMAPADAGAPPYPPRRTPDEVLVVYNANSPVSTAIAKDYAQKRNVPNVLSINCADSAMSEDNETIELADYTSSIAAPISAYLASNSKINFIVLTKGIPIRIADANTGCCMDNGGPDGGPGQPSVDSYLAAIDYPQIPGASEIGITGSGTIGRAWLNRYWNAVTPFTHAQFGGYLVTRLDGYTQADAMELVTRALAAEQGLTDGPVMLDVDINHGLGDKTMAPEPLTFSDYDPALGVTAEWDWSVWNADMLRAHDLLEASGISNQLYMTGTFVGGVSNLLGYFSWGSNDSSWIPESGSTGSLAYNSLGFSPGGIGDTAVSTSGRSFFPQTDGQSMIADLIAQGITGVKGDTGEPILQAVTSPSILMPKYTHGFSLADSYYAAARFVGWVDVFIGDPLCTPYFGPSSRPMVVPTYASNFDDSSGGVQTEDCGEGGMDVGNITAGSYTVYKSVQLTGARTLAVRVASAGDGGNVEVHLDSATGTMLGSCTVPVTGDWQTWTTQTCALAAGTGAHDLYLVFTGGANPGDYLFNLDWFAFRP
jgi:hypothetical protein